MFRFIVFHVRQLYVSFGLGHMSVRGSVECGKHFGLQKMIPI